jgi:hypothetical protein
MIYYIIILFFQKDRFKIISTGCKSEHSILKLKKFMGVYHDIHIYAFVFLYSAAACFMRSLEGAVPLCLA